MPALVHSRLLILAGLVATFVTAISFIYFNFPELAESDRDSFKYPRNLGDAKQLGRLLSRYKEQNFTVVLCGVIVVYIILQSFAIPGSLFLTILSGYLFPFPIALTLVCTCSATGAGICYLLSLMFGRELVMRNFSDRVAQWQSDIAKHQDNLMYYIVFLRVTPFLPNWFINIASPVMDVPFSPFFWGTFLGVAPPSFLYIQAGSTLEQMTHTNVAWSWTSVMMLTFFAVLSLVPVMYKRYTTKSKSD